MKIQRLRAWLVLLLCLGLMASSGPSSLAQTTGSNTDLGDAPTSENNQNAKMTAYPDGTAADFPTVYADAAGGPRNVPGPKHVNSVLAYHLGSQISGEDEADSGSDEDGVNNIDPSNDKADQDGADDGVNLPSTLPHCEFVTIPVVINVPSPQTVPAYLNLWFDWERDGTWSQRVAPKCNNGAEAPDWVVKDKQVSLIEQGLQTVEVRVQVWNPNPSKPMWVRATLSEQQAPASDGRGPTSGYQFGETEDYLWPGESTTPTDTPTPTATRPADDTPTATATRPSDDTPTATATRPSEDTPTATATRPADDTPTATATRPSEETPTATATRPSETPTTEPRPEKPEIRIIESDNKRFEALIRFPELVMTEIISPGNETYQQIALKNQTEPVSGDSSSYGKPAIPVINRLLAIPKDSLTPTIRLTELMSTATISDILIYPSQPSPVDQTDPEEEDTDFSDRPFQIDEVAYRQETAFPEALVSVRRLGSWRDMDLVLISMATAQYYPAKRQLVPIKSFKLNVEFVGGKGYFLPRPGPSTPFEGAFDKLQQPVMNELTLPNFPGPAASLDLASCVGYEFIIITAPGLRDAADALAGWKWQKGISTKVVETGAGDDKAGTTATEIRSYLRNEYKRCQIRPSYAMFLGDTRSSNVVPTWYPTRYKWNKDKNKYIPYTIPSDLPYSIMNPPSENVGSLPELALGRIPVRTLADANVVVNKIINYEKSPPKMPSFYKNVTMASYFQCCRPSQTDGSTSRGYIYTAELVQNYITQSKTFNRIYNTDTNFHDDPDNAYYNPDRDATPRFYYNLQSLPNALQPPFSWNGSRTEISSAINSGSFLVQHRGHGSRASWASPNYTTSDVNALSNGSLLPVVFSINCTSGNFDATGDSMADAFLKNPNGGAVGVIGDTSVSPTWANNALTRGLYDAIWPDFLPDYGQNKSIRRLGDILNYAKIYMFNDSFNPQPSLDKPFSTDHAWKNIDIYHVIGDPTMQIWREDPNVYPPLKLGYKVAQQSNEQWLIEYPETGAKLTVLDASGRPMGRGTVDENGQATIPVLPTLPSPSRQQVDASNVQIIAELDDRPSVVLQTAVNKTYLPLMVKP